MIEVPVCGDDYLKLITLRFVTVAARDGASPAAAVLHKPRPGIRA